MPFVPVGLPQPLAIRGPFAAVTIDAQRRRVFAAGVHSVVVLDADTGKVLATVRFGGARSIALEPLGGHLFAATADGEIAEIDPDRKTIVRSLDADGPVDELLYDSNTGRLFADGGGRAAIATFDARAFAAAAPLPLAGRIPAALVPDPVTGELYVAFADRPEIAIVDPRLGTVRGGFPTPGLLGDRIVRFDDALGQIVVIGANGLLDIYDRAGTRRARLAVPAGIVACDLDTGNHVLACTDRAALTFVQLRREAAPQIIGSSPLDGPSLVALDAKTNDALVLRSQPDGTGSSVERLRASAATPSPAPAVP